LTPFVTADCIEDAAQRVSVGDFHKGYQRFCDQNDIPKDRRLGMKRIARLMDARYESAQIDGVRDG
jgi:hypothetical protein